MSLKIEEHNEDQRRQLCLYCCSSVQICKNGQMEMASDRRHIADDREAEHRLAESNDGQHAALLTI